MGLGSWFATGMSLFTHTSSLSLSIFLNQVSEAKTLVKLQQLMEPLTDYPATAGCLRSLTGLVEEDS